MKFILSLIIATCMMLVACEEIPFDNPIEQDDTQTSGGITEDGAVDALFSVSDSTKVRFSRGNLQYQASTGTWRFAENQYDYMGKSNDNISPTYSGWIDLFGYGTSGWSSGAIACQPYSTSIITYDYLGYELRIDLTGSYANADWGVYNPISNGGNQPGMWRTLTAEEWKYIYNTRKTSTLNGKENARFCRAVVNGVVSLILFPDNYTHPRNVPLPDSINYSGPGTTPITYDININTYSADQWLMMEQAGCVLLPAAGRRYGTEAKELNYRGRYWSSTHDYNQGKARVTMFSQDGVSSNMTFGIIQSGNSVRLVRDVE